MDRRDPPADPGEDAVARCDGVLGPRQVAEDLSLAAAEPAGQREAEREQCPGGARHAQGGFRGETVENPAEDGDDLPRAVLRAEVLAVEPFPVGRREVGLHEGHRVALLMGEVLAEGVAGGGHGLVQPPAVGLVPGRRHRGEALGAGVQGRVDALVLGGHRVEDRDARRVGHALEQQWPQAAVLPVVVLVQDVGEQLPPPGPAAPSSRDRAPVSRPSPP